MGMIDNSAYGIQTTRQAYFLYELELEVEVEVVAAVELEKDSRCRHFRCQARFGERVGRERRST